MNETEPTQSPSNYSPFYTNLNKAIFHGESEKSFVDKLLGRQDADKLHELIKKEPLTLSDIEEILFLMTSIDQKLLNYDEWDRYIIVKLFPWVKDFSIICKTMMIYQNQYENGDFNKDFKDTKVKDDTYKIIQEINKYLLHDFKFLISTFLLVSNTTLSIDGAAFEVLTTSKFEYSYPSVPLPQPQERRSILNVFKTKK
jgi:hypothetical protein